MSTEPTPEDTILENMTNDCIVEPGTNAGTTRLTFEFCVVDIGLPQTISSVTPERSMHNSYGPVYPGELPKTGASGILLVVASLTLATGFVMKRIGRPKHERV